jgi:hypothetical protein
VRLSRALDASTGRALSTLSSTTIWTCPPAAHAGFDLQRFLTSDFYGRFSDLQV